MTAYQRLMLPENLNYAWQKARRLYRMWDGFIDYGELAKFELDLENQLKLINQKFVKGNYQTKPLRILPRPKKIVKDKPVDRQYFHVAVEDQVAWLAVVNALGPTLDKEMPPWSYGNRLYRPAWYEDEEERHSKLELGPYRHASGHLHRKFKHSWPLFRRHLVLTAKSMTRTFDYNQIDTLDLPERLAAISARELKLPYLNSSFWSNSKVKVGTDLYFAAIDLKHFFPNISIDAVLNGVLSAIDEEDSEYEKFNKLLRDMLRFRLNEIELSEHARELVEPKFTKRLRRGIPTGLFVSGFLANVAMLKVDQKVNSRIFLDRSVAHFRFVDDHAILTYDFDQLCSWINWYKKVLEENQTGLEINKEKIEPKSLAEFLLKQQSDARISDSLRQQARVDTKIDGANPTKLHTKTLGQVSAIATQDSNLLNDKDLKERLKQLEWLLLADIPDHEIRADTRASFAAGQIANIAPLLVEEVEGLVDEHRSLEHLKLKLHESTKLPDETTEKLKKLVEHKSKVVDNLRQEFEKNESKLFRHCFSLLFQAFKNHPSKTRIFFRLQQYCRVTGFSGLQEVGEWIQQTRNQKNLTWADYYCGLTLQILADGILRACRSVLSETNLRSDRISAERHIEDVSKLDKSLFLVPVNRETWFYRMAKREFAVSTISVARCLEQVGKYETICNGLRKLSADYANITFENPSEDWQHKTGYRPGVWAHRFESNLSINNTPSNVWGDFEKCFDYEIKSDRLSVRRYPELLSDLGWTQLLQSTTHLVRLDSGWIRDSLKTNQGRSLDEISSRNKALSRAVKNSMIQTENKVSVVEWTNFIKTECSPFDPRRSEWTALEVVRQVVTPSIETIGVQTKNLDRIHPYNILIPETWKSDFRADSSWSEWRSFLEEEIQHGNSIKFLEPKDSIVDYRFFNFVGKPIHANIWDRRLTSIGRLLLGLLRFDHNAPAVWNIRGNEHIHKLPLVEYSSFLAISSKTLLLLDGCLSGRSAETRTIKIEPELFGWEEGKEINDLRFDPVTLENPNKLVVAINEAQQNLVENQLSVSMNQPRQLIPFNLSDLSTDTGDMIESENDA